MNSFPEDNNFLLRLIDSIPVGMVVFNLEGQITFINSNCLNFIESPETSSAYLEKSILDLFELKELKDKIQDCLLTGGEDFLLNNCQINKRYFEVSAKKIEDGILIILRDVTNNLLKSQESTKLLIQGQELERRRLAKEIHDGIGPFLSSVKLNVDLLTSQTNEMSTHNELKNISKHISEISNEIRQVSHELMPSSLVDFGLITGVENFIGRMNKNHTMEFEVEHDLNDEGLIFNLDQALNIFRIIQESINNAIKHSQATKIIVRFKRQKKSFFIEIEDNGIGMKIQQGRKGIGLTNIQTRVKSINGKCKFVSKENNGLKVSLRIPIKIKK